MAAICVPPVEVLCDICVVVEVLVVVTIFAFLVHSLNAFSVFLVVTFFLFLRLVSIGFGSLVGFSSSRRNFGTFLGSYFCSFSFLVISFFCIIFFTLNKTFGFDVDRFFGSGGGLFLI